MQIESSSSYSRNMINSMPQQRPEQNQGAGMQETNQTRHAAQSTINKKDSVSSTSQVNNTGFNLKNLPQKLEDVLNSEEKAMLQDLFPVNGSQWGVDAYKMSNVVSKNNMLGARLDLTT